MKLKPYQSYKESDVLWSDSIPSGWDIKQVKHLFSIGRGRVIAETELEDDGAYPVFSSQTQSDGCMGFINTYDFDCEQLTWTTDGANAGTVFLRNGKHNCTNVCGTLQPIQKQDFNLRFYLHTLGYVTQFYKRPDTNGAKIMNGEMAAIKLPFPSALEQQKITNFLDREIAKLDDLITKQEKLIELLQEKRQAIISHAVIKGLNPDAKMKDSGLEWLGEVPEEWVTASMRWLASIYSGGTPDKEKLEYWLDGTIPWINSGEVNQRLISEPSAFITEEAFNKSSAKWIPKGALVMALAGQGKTKGMVAQLAIETTCNQSMAAIIPQEKINSRYLFWWLTSQYQNIRNLSGGDLRDGLNLDLLGSISCPIPPLAEQESIAYFLDLESTKIDTLIEKARRSIELAKEHRTALISTAVTGKIDVREAV